MVGAEWGASAAAWGRQCVSPPSTSPSFFSRKRKQKGISCRGSGWGEQPAGCQWLEEGPRCCSPWCCCLSWGLVGSPLGVWQAGGAASLPCLLGGSRGFCSPGSLLARATISPNLLLPALCLLEEMLHPADFLPPFPVFFAAPSCGHS